MEIDIQRLEELAKLSLTHEEREQVRLQLPKILAYVAQLQELSLPDYRLEVQEEVYLREDVAALQISERDAALQLFPQAKAGALQVPSVGARTAKHVRFSDDLDKE